MRKARKLKQNSVLLAATFLAVVEVQASEENKYFSKENLQPENILSHLTQVFTSHSGRKVYVFDDLISHPLVLASMEYYQGKRNWKPLFKDDVGTEPKEQFKIGNGIPWKVWDNPVKFGSTRVGTTFSSIISALATKSSPQGGNSYRQYQMIEAYAGMLRRLDVTTLHVESKQHSNETVEGYSMMLFANIIWSQDNYGELLFYEDGDDLDIFGLAAPRFGRIVVWDSAIPYILRPPSITFVGGEYVIFARFHSDPQVIYENRQYFIDWMEDIKDGAQLQFKSLRVDEKDIDNSAIDLDKHLTLKRQSKDHASVYVFDELFAKSDLDALREYIIKYGKFLDGNRVDFDSDNVDWIAVFTVDAFVHTKFWPVVQQIAHYITGQSSWFPYNVACNLIRSTDHTRFHKDMSNPREKELTFLLYLSPNWTADQQGETAFFHYRRDREDNDYVAEVVPMYGRAVIFDGRFDHSARPTSPSYAGPRYTFAVKLSETKLLGVRKNLYEESDQGSASDTYGVISDILSNATQFAVNRRFNAHLQRLKVRGFHQRLGYIRNQKSEEEDFPGNEEGSTSGVSDEEMEAVGDVLDEEELASMTPELIEKVILLTEHFGMSGEDNEEESMVETPNVEINLGSRPKAWEAQLRKCKGNPDCLNEYLKLMQRQNVDLREKASNALFSLI